MGVMRESHRLRAKGAEWASAADQIEAASTHLLGLTAGTHMTDSGMDVKAVRDNFGHATISSTSIYIHSEDDARHDATKGSSQDRVGLYEPPQRRAVQQCIITGNVGKIEPVLHKVHAKHALQPYTTGYRACKSYATSGLYQRCLKRLPDLATCHKGSRNP